MGNPAGVKPHGNRDCRQSPDINWAGISQQKEFAGAQKVGILFQFRDRRRRNRGCRRYQQIHLSENCRDVVACAYQFLAALLKFFRAHVFSGTNPAKSFGLVKFGAACHEPGMKDVRLGALQGPVGRNRKLHFAKLRTQGCHARESVSHRRRNIRVEIVKKEFSAARRFSEASGFSPAARDSLQRERPHWLHLSHRSRRWPEK